MKVTPQGKIDALALAIARGATIKHGAEAAGMSERVARMKVRDREFKAQVDGIRSEILGQAVGLLTSASMKAVVTLVKLLDDREPATIRLGAARAILASVIEVTTTTDIKVRLDDLKARMDARDARVPVKVQRNGNGR